MDSLLQFTILELVALLGLAHALWLLVYMVLRAGQIRYVSLALACFSTLAVAFLADFGARYLTGIELYPLGQDFIWHSLPVFSALLCIQIVRIDGLPEARYFLIFLLLPLMALGAWLLSGLVDKCTFFAACDVSIRRQALDIIGIVVGGISLLTVWLDHRRLDGLVKEKSFKSDRYWLILALVFINCAQLFLTLSFVSGLVGRDEYLLIRDILGCGLVYLASSSLFRIYPQALKVTPKNINKLTDQEVSLITKIEELLTLQKVYQESGYSRSDLARELSTSEATVTRAVNAHYNKSVTQLINQRRVEDAMRLLKETEAPISVVAEQVGFSSLPSFNRVFKDITGLSPSEYRAA